MSITLREICTQVDPMHHISVLVDSYHRNSDMCLDSILDVPNLSAVQKSMIAASVDALCSSSGVEPPNWVFDDITYLHEPVFAMNAKGKLRLVLLQESPEWFRSRNLFVTANVLERA